MDSPGEIDRTEQERGFSRSQFDGGPKDNHSTRPANALRLIHFELFFSERKKKTNADYDLSGWPPATMPAGGGEEKRKGRPEVGGVRETGAAG